jgi:penicillin-binding protein 1A
VVVPLVGVVGLLGTLWYVYAHTEIPEIPVAAQTTLVYDRNGKLITRLHEAENRTVISLEGMPEHLRQAVIAVEDENFYQHGGISPLAIVRAAWADLTSGEIRQGGSTITQQYVKNVFTGSERSFSRKIKEAILAVKVDRELTKNEILENYLNTVYFGNGAYGVQAAALTYWGIRAPQLSVDQAALLAGLIQRPSAYEPFNHPDAARGRRNVVLDRMAEEGYLTPARAEELKAKPVEVKPEEGFESSPFAYFVSHVSRVVQDQFGYDATFKGGLRVRTTLDRTAQQAAQDAVAAHLDAPGDPSAAVVAIDPVDGAIRAMVGGKDFTKAKLNLATQGHRQTGSAFKTFTLTAAMEEKISLRSTWKGPSELVIPDERCFDEEGDPWEVHNYADSSAGTMDLASATANSVNTIFAQVVVQVSPEKVAQVANRMGIESTLAPVCSITLGSQDVTPLEMTAGYATLASRGIRHQPQSITSVETAQGDVLHTWETPGDQVLLQNDADLVTHALQQVVESGTGEAADIGRPVAGKTGTAQSYRDAWFCGYTPQLAACVWVGYPKAQIEMHDIQGFESVTGGSIPALIWHDFMAVAMERLPIEDFATPSFEGYDRFPEGALTPTPSRSPAARPSPTPRPTRSPRPRPSESPSPEPEPEPSPSPSESPPPSPTPSESPSPTPTASGSPGPSPTGAPDVRGPPDAALHGWFP